MREAVKRLEADKEFFTPELCYIIEVSNSADDEPLRSRARASRLASPRVGIA